jgi:transposase
VKKQSGHIILTVDEYNKLLSDNVILREELEQLKRLIFGKKNERFVSENTDSKQLGLFDEQIEAQPEEQPNKETVSYQRSKKQKKQAKRTALPAFLRRFVETYLPDNLPEDAVKIGELVTEILEYKPGEIYVRRLVRPKFVVKSKDKDAENQIIAADMPSGLPLPRANAGAGLLSHLLVSKYIDHLPFYRQRQIFKRQKIDLAESTINDWFSSVCKLLEPLYNELKKQTLQGSYIQADESPMPVLTKDKAGSAHKGYQWVYHNPPDKLVFFDYRKGRDQSGPKEILKSFSGILQTDGYAGYNDFGRRTDTTLAACWAHVRRKFEHALQNYTAVAEPIMLRIQAIYATEKKIKEENYSEEQILEIRQKESKPIVEDIQSLLMEQKDNVLPKSDIGKAINYAISLMPRLKVYLSDARILIDNNLIENAIRPLALGRKNYLFAGSHHGAQRAAMMYSFFGSCKLNGVEPQQWLKSTLEKILDYNIQNLKELLPKHKV